MNPTLHSDSVGIFSSVQIENFRKIKAAIQKSAVWVFVGGVALAAILLLLGGWSEAKAISNTIGTLFVIGAMLIISAFNFTQIEQSTNKGVQAFALFGAIMNVLWALLWIGAIWGVYDMWSCNYGCYGSAHTVSLPGRFAYATTNLSALGLFGAATLAVKEERKKSSIRPLKITAISCLVYAELYFTFVIMAGFNVTSEIAERFAALAGFASFAWFISLMIMLVLSGNTSSKAIAAKNAAIVANQNQAANPTPVPAPTPATKPQQKTEEELRAEIEEQVRREMIEKEVRAKIEKEMAEKAGK